LPGISVSVEFTFFLGIGCATGHDLAQLPLPHISCKYHLIMDVCNITIHLNPNAPITSETALSACSASILSTCLTNAARVFGEIHNH
jgi:hypothetical protein